jgi:AraC-like DNA-binding protein
MHSTMRGRSYSPAQSTSSKSPRQLSSTGETEGICSEAYIDPAVQHSTDIAMERHYTIAEIARLWHLNYKTVRRLFGSEPGVLIFGPGERRFKRSHVSMRVPETVMLRVHRRCRQSN